ncbi:MAG: acyl-CoA dehydrogenase family protein [Bdellovibrionales bacterium]|nr:acyl-CoA dehydrogenase family protein [Bdellovibrionales bacterium]
MAEKSFLEWPFFHDAHRALYQQLVEWREDQSDLCTREPVDFQSEDVLARELISSLAEAGFLALCVGEEHSQTHSGLDVRSLCLSREALAYASPMADFCFAMQGLGSGPISLFGTKEQREKYLAGVREGELIAAFALSEKKAGSDVSAISCNAVKDGDGYILNGEKAWISNAGLADFYVVFAKTDLENNPKALGAFIVEKGDRGFRVEERNQIISPHPLGTLSLNQCRIPKGRLIGDPTKGFRIAMATLDVFRTTVGAAALGFAKRALDETIRHAKQRELFGQHLSDFQMIQSHIAEMDSEVDASSLLIYRSAWLKDSGAERITRESSIAKLYATDSAQRTIDRAVQVFGGLGVTSNSVPERLYRAIRPLRIYEGASEIQKIVIARQVLERN